MFASRIAPALASLALLGACATATPYQAATDSDRGFTEQQIESDRWQVSFSGNSLTERQTVETYLLYRAAELTAEQGFDHFRVVKRDTDEDSRLVPLGFSSGRYDPFYSGFYCNYRFYGAHSGRFFTPRRSAFGPYYGDPFGYGFGGPEYREIVRYEANAEIILGRGDDVADADVFDASEVLDNLSNRIVRPEDLA